MIQAIVYDAVGTLIHVKPSVAALYAEVGRQFGSHLDEAAIQTRFHAAFARQDRHDEQAGWRTSEARERQRWQAIVAEVLDDVADRAGCFERLFTTFSKAEAWSCDPDAAEVLTYALDKGYRQALASNFDRRLHGILAQMPALQTVAPVVLSSEVGWRKPAAEFFTALADTLQLPTSAILFVGDDRSNDYEAARRAGMCAVLLDPRRRHRDVGSDRVDRLGALLTLL